VIRAHQPGSEPIDIPETIPNPVVIPKPTPTPTEPAPKAPVSDPGSPARRTIYEVFSSAAHQRGVVSSLSKPDSCS